MRARSLAIAAAVALAACGPPKPAELPHEPGVGDLSFRLTWSGQADLDLSVAEPNGEGISFAHPTAASGGTLDVDCNALPTMMCASPTENIFWPAGHAPRGIVRVRVRLTNSRRDPLPIAFTLVERRRGRIANSDTGAIGHFGDFWQMYVLEPAR